MRENDIVQDFLVESSENLDRLDRDLVELEKNPRDKNALAACSVPSTPSRALWISWVQQVGKRSHMLARTFSPGCATANSRSKSPNHHRLLGMVDAVRQMLREIHLQARMGRSIIQSCAKLLTRLQTPGSEPATGTAASRGAPGGRKGRGGFGSCSAACLRAADSGCEPRDTAPEKPCA